MNILFVGPPGGTSGHRIRAFERLGHQVHTINPDRFAPRHPLLARIDWESGGLLFQRRIMTAVLKEIDGVRFDFTWVEGGRCVGPHLVKQLRRCGPVINYNHDDPFGKRDRFAWLLYRKAVPEYDLIVVVRKPNVAEGQKAGAKKVLLCWRVADEVAHAPRLLLPEDHARWDSEVMFAGTWFPERGQFMADLVRRGVPLSIYGNRWQKAKEWPALQQAWRGQGLTNDDDYARAIQCAKISLGLVSKGNRDLHTTRSLEIPSLGGLFCAERTPEHKELYLEGQEALYWRDSAECADVCLDLLAHDDRRIAVARAGRDRSLRNGHFNERLISHTLTQAMCP